MTHGTWNGEYRYTMPGSSYRSGMQPSVVHVAVLLNGAVATDGIFKYLSCKRSQQSQRNHCKQVSTPASLSKKNMRIASASCSIGAARFGLGTGFSSHARPGVGVVFHQHCCST